MSDATASGAALRLPPRLPLPAPAPPAEGALDQVGKHLTAWAQGLSAVPRAWRLSADLASVRKSEAGLPSLDDAALSARLRDLRLALGRRELDRRTLVPGLALLSETARRSLGQHPHDGQLRAVFSLLDGRLVELGPGEGKTLAAALAAAVAGLGGRPVHVIAPDDHRSRRAARRMAPFYRALGLSLGVITEASESADRRAAYRCDVTYGSGREIAFDQLRDRLHLGGRGGALRLKLERLYSEDPRGDGLMQRDLGFAILDDADSILLDRAADPLVVSGRTDPLAEARQAEEALEIAADLEPGVDFRVLVEEARSELTEEGCARLAERAEAMGGIWRSRGRREAAACAALSALHLFRRDSHYQVADGEVVFSDPDLRRFLDQRGAEDGLEAIIAVKEGCRAKGRLLTQARTTLHQVLRRYPQLCGLSATARDSAAEIRSVYRLPLARVAPRRRHPCRSVGYVLPSRGSQREAVVLRGRALMAAGRPLLVLAMSRASVAELAEHLVAAGLSPVLLDGLPEEARAEALAGAGQAGRLTLASPAALEGWEPPGAEAGGPRVLLVEQPGRRRLERRLRDLAARCGAPGRIEALLSLEDPLLEGLEGAMMLRLGRLPGGLGQAFCRRALRAAQRRREALEARQRRDAARADLRLGEMLAFTVGAE